MIPHVIQITLPPWIQIVIAVTAILANVGTFAFVVFVLWPSIRNQERRARRLETWMETAEFERIRRAVISKIDQGDGLDASGKSADKKTWWDNPTEDGARSGL